MKGCGIICEYNPFHTGHKYQIEQVKKKLDAPVVCAMSGNFTQRGEASFMDKKDRAKIAVDNGADVVLEIPFPFCSMSANGFARAGVYILSKSGLCSHIAFGSECGDVNALTECAQLICSKAFGEKVKELQKQDPTLSFARARTIVLEAQNKTFLPLVTNPNDILALEYIMANTALGSPLEPVAIKRSTPRGGKDESFASSSYIRKLFTLCEAFPEEVKRYAPGIGKNTQIFEKDENFAKFAITSLLTKTPEDLKGIAEIDSGSAHSMIRSAKTADSAEQFLALVKTKSTTDAKVRRMLLFALARVPKEMLKQYPLYTTLLCFSDSGQALLSQNKKQRDIIIASKISNIKSNKQAFCQYELCRKTEEVVEKCRKW